MIVLTCAKALKLISPHSAVAGTRTVLGKQNHFRGFRFVRLFLDGDLGIVSPQLFPPFLQQTFSLVFTRHLLQFEVKHSQREGQLLNFTHPLSFICVLTAAATVNENIAEVTEIILFLLVTIIGITCELHVHANSFDKNFGISFTQKHPPARGGDVLASLKRNIKKKLTNETSVVTVQFSYY